MEQKPHLEELQATYSLAIDSAKGKEGGDFYHLHIHLAHALPAAHHVALMEAVQTIEDILQPRVSSPHHVITGTEPRLLSKLTRKSR